ncbi:agamous-like MADS-box protein AGL61 [Diospyros lotus]|uniref:agamous-like MADS-box protein AGL61 n=1 Tax=Diospyros lotus TaxID=55363 RepID=UPI00225034F1|nr:agamous-like MADS-box protein AGL61 [Diospyros lotus]
MGTGKKKIEIKRVEKEQQRMVTFSKRRQGLFKKAGQLHSLAAASVAVVAFSPAGRPYTHGDPSFGAVVDRYLAKTTAGLKDSAAAMNMTKMSSWLHAPQIDGSDDIQELVLMKKQLEEIKEKVAEKIINAHDSSF